ncbi:hypothetical protein CPB83DRAFT_840789 [Crepidotus variabilis]|uniref:Uncharacterized protein n=1 Tax=Crepidotus variabilis TaxID=179855 RepID=A0A9P6JIC3_9AGAR|nr:hypothetical protein CPB83DRAFT_840789 [Crepidotus variabilis]
MGSFFSSFGVFSLSPNDIGLVVYATINTKILNVTSVRVHPAGSLVTIGNEYGSIALYRVDDANPLCHRFSLSYKYGGVSEICWTGHEYVVVGTTRGRLIVFKLEGDGRRLYEVSHVVAHGDGAAQIDVNSIAYNSRTKFLASVGEGKKSVRLWEQAEDGSLKEKLQPLSTTAFSAARYVTFFREGHQLLVAFLEHPLIQIFTLEPFALSQELQLEFEGSDQKINTFLLIFWASGNALILEGFGKLAIYSLTSGCNFFDSTTMAPAQGQPLIPKQFVIQECSQALAALRDGAYVASVSGPLLITIIRTTDGKYCGNLKSRGQQDLLIAASITDDGSSTLTIWLNKRRLIVTDDQQHDHSNLKIVMLCIAISLLFQVSASFFSFRDINQYFYGSAEVDNQDAHTHQDRILSSDSTNRCNVEVGITSSKDVVITPAPTALVGVVSSLNLQTSEESLCTLAARI